jgi:hypothetical protein
MSPTDVTTRPIRSRPRAPMVALIVGAVLAAIALVAATRAATATPAVVDHVTVDNATPYGVDVTLRDSESAGLIQLGRALPEGETTWQQVHDSGERWIFTFTRAGIVAGQVEVSRTQLEQAGWRVATPGAVEQRLADAGLRPYPEEGAR